MHVTNTITIISKTISSSEQHVLCYNLNFGLATKAKAYKVAGQG